MGDALERVDALVPDRDIGMAELITRNGCSALVMWLRRVTRKVRQVATAPAASAAPATACNNPVRALLRAYIRSVSSAATARAASAASPVSSLKSRPGTGTGGSTTITT